ncbi:MAG: hypothetical protein MUC87_10465 [Bacteroidia bacterium]|jgi:hypothetical protein|nr:hypothetical protein [Bacteroidia bacterium]
MRYFILILSVFILWPESGCTRKGEGDPLISLRTRKARLDGEWKIVSGTGAYQINQTVEPWAFNGTVMTFTSGNQNSVTVSYQVEFRKDGIYTWTQQSENTWSGGTSTTVETGRWNFKSGKDDSKRKEEIVLQPENVFPSYYSSQLPYERVFELHTLRNDKVVMKRSYPQFSAAGYDLNNPVNKEEWTLEPLAN